MHHLVRPLAALLLYSCLHAMAAEPVVLRTAIEAESELKWNLDGKSGLCPEILRAIMRKDPGLQIGWGDQVLPQKRLVAQVEIGALDLACALGRTAERAERLIIPEVVLYNNTLVAAVRKDDPFDFNELAELKKLAAGDVVLLNNGARLVERLHAIGIDRVDAGAKRPVENLRKLSLGRGRVFLFHEPGMAWEIDRAGLDARLRILPAALSVDQHFLMLSRRLAPETVARVAAALNQMKADGSLRTIAAHWSPRRDVSTLHAPAPP